MEATQSKQSKQGTQSSHFQQLKLKIQKKRFEKQQRTERKSPLTVYEDVITHSDSEIELLDDADMEVLSILNNTDERDDCDILFSRDERPSCIFA